MKIIRPAIAAILFLISQMLFALELPVPSNGFEWVEAPEIKGAFLKPKGWHFKKHKKGSTQSYYLTKENIDKVGSFTTGVTISVIPNIPKKLSISPTQYAAKFVKEAAASRPNIKAPWSHSMGPFNSFGVVLRNPDLQNGDFNTHNLAISNDQTGTVYVVIFEAPTANWESSWKVGEEILGKLYIDSDI